MKRENYHDRKIDLLIRQKASVRIRYYDHNGSVVEHYSGRRTLDAVRAKIKKYRAEGKTIVYASVLDYLTDSLEEVSVSVETGEVLVILPALEIATR